MGDKKAKVKAASDPEAKKIILDYLKKQNRPFNAVMLYENLHGAVKKTQAVKIMADLAVAGKLVEKLKGKQKIYWAEQEGLNNIDADSMEKIDKQIEALKEEKKPLIAQISEIQSSISGLHSALTDREIEEETQRLADENAELESKLKKLRGGAKLVSKKDKEKAEKQYDSTRAEWRKRKRICIDIVKGVGEPTGKRDKEIIKEVELETDEEVGASITAETRTAKRRKIMGTAS